MSKWLNKDLFKAFEERVKNDVPSENNNPYISRKWGTEKGTAEKPKTYEIRFLPDETVGGYVKYYYHMYKSGEKWKFVICPKSEDLNNPCPLCSVVNKLYERGTEEDKKEASRLKRKVKFVSNVLVIDDPRDSERNEEDKCNGKVFLYEFPQKLEQKIAEEIRDGKNGLGKEGIFSPDETGYNFFIKVGSQSGGDGSTTFPEYSMSQFARKPSPIAESDAAIEKIFETRLPLKDYINNQKKSVEDIIKLVKEEMLFPLIEKDYKNFVDKEEKEVPELDKNKEIKEEPKEEPKKKEEPKQSDAEITEEDLLKELEDL